MSRMRHLTKTEKMEIVRAAAEGMTTSEFAARFGMMARAIRYVLTADAERQKDTAVATAAVTVNLTLDELVALDAVFFAAGIKTRTEGLRRLI